MDFPKLLLHSYIILCTTFEVSDTKSPRNIASRKKCPRKCSSKKKGLWLSRRWHCCCDKPCCRNQNSSKEPIKHSWAKEKQIRLKIFTSPSFTNNERYECIPLPKWKVYQVISLYIVRLMIYYQVVYECSCKSNNFLLDVVILCITV